MCLGAALRPVSDAYTATLVCCSAAGPQMNLEEVLAGLPKAPAPGVTTLPVLVDHFLYSLPAHNKLAAENLAARCVRPPGRRRSDTHARRGDSQCLAAQGTDTRPPACAFLTPWPTQTRPQRRLLPCQHRGSVCSRAEGVGTRRARGKRHTRRLPAVLRVPTRPLFRCRVSVSDALHTRSHGTGPAAASRAGAAPGERPGSG